MADVLVDTTNKTPAELLAQGVKAFVLQDFNAAVAALSKASELLVNEHQDDLHESLGDVYLYYGKALLGVSREENEALGDAVPRNNSEDSGDEDDEQAENGEENGDENGEEHEKDEDNEKAETEKPEKASATEDAGESSNGVASLTKEDSKDKASGSAAEPDKPEDKPEPEEEPTDLQLAWEVLELAKKIFEKLGEAGKKNLAETLTVLGEISMESENFESAVSDIKEGLAIQRRLFGPDSRTVAETLYKLGVAQSANSEIEEAVRSFQSSMEYLKTRMGALEKQEEAEEELREIASLLPDIEEKIVDIKSYKEEALKKIVSAVTEAKAASEGGASTSSSIEAKPVLNISHLVKRKRKADEIVDDKSEDNPKKKPNQ